MQRLVVTTILVIVDYIQWASLRYFQCILSWKSSRKKFPQSGNFCTHSSVTRCGLLQFSFLSQAAKETRQQHRHPPPPPIFRHIKNMLCVCDM